MADQIATEIPESLDGARLDKALATLLHLSRSRARELIERGVTVDGEPGRPGSRVRAGAIVHSEGATTETPLTPEPVEFGVLYEDDDVIVVDKPAGLVVHPGAGHRAGTLVAGLVYRYPEIEGIGQQGRWGLVHRLDKSTSGAMVVARSGCAFESLSRQVRERSVERNYLALVDGLPDSPTGTIEAPIGRDPERPTRRAVVRGGKPARTHFVVEESFPERGCSLLRCRLETGRTHQIRVHLAAIGHPVIGDRTYGKKTAVTAPRTFLHSSRVEFSHPSDDTRVSVEAPLPADLRGVLRGLDSDD